MDGRRAGIWGRRIEPDWPAIRAGLWRRRVAVLVGLGAAFRIAQYLHGRSFWMDESSLLANARMASPRAFLGPLNASQLAPPGFLLLEWAAIRVAGDSTFGARLVPLLAGIGSIGLFLAVARRVLGARAVPAAVALFATADDLIYFASEAKQYSSDVAAALGVTLLGLTVGAGAMTARRAAILAASGAAVVWFSHPAVFVLAAVGTTRLAGRLTARDWRGAAAWCAVGLAWVGSFAAVHAVAMEQLVHADSMWKFWAFAFPPIPPRSPWDASWPLRRLAYFFANPLHFGAPLGPRWSPLPALALAWIGATRIGRAGPDRLAILAGPIALTLAASCLRLYPFHGRLVLFLAPAVLLLIAAGLDRVRDLRFAPRAIYAILAALLIGVPMLSDFYGVFEPRDRDNFSPYGDRRSSRFDPERYPL